MTYTPAKLCLLVSTFAVCLPSVSAVSQEAERSVRIWKGIAPGETTESLGVALPRRKGEVPPATRIKDITAATLDIFRPDADKNTGTAVIICPGGGYNYCVVDKEGSEIAQRLNEAGVTGIVLRYRTKRPTGDDTLWARPLQDAQRAIRWVRSHAQELEIQPDQVGVMGCSAGGQLAALTLTRFDEPSYETRDTIDELSCRPDFGLLIYPWRLVEGNTTQLNPALTINSKTPPTFLVHTHDDSSTSLSSIAFYTQLKFQGVPAELHLFETGGHGYGLRPVKNSIVHTWGDRAIDWLAGRNLSHPRSVK